MATADEKEKEATLEDFYRIEKRFYITQRAQLCVYILSPIFLRSICFLGRVWHGVPKVGEPFKGDNESCVLGELSSHPYKHFPC